MLDILGTVAGNILSLPGILGLALGMMTRNMFVAGALGALVGILKTIVFADLKLANVETGEMVIAIAVGVLFACLGTLVRRIGATV